MYFILFEFMIKYIFLNNFCKYLRILMDTCRYEKNRRVPV